MSFQLNVPPSVISRLAKEADKDGDGGELEIETQDLVKKREDWRKLKELEEARKAGTAPAMQDEEGRDINPHIPQYIMQAPWYFGSTVPTLSHQREQEEKMLRFDSGWYKKGVKEGPVSTKFRKGACENCGATSHIKKDCLERPRKIGARFTGKDFAPDEYTQPDLNLSYDGKRDRWNGYDSVEHKRIIEEFQKIDEAKRLLKAQRIEELVQSGMIAPEEAKKVAEEDDEGDEDKYAEDVDMPGHKFESKQRITVRNLRIREDTAKYLYNLDVNSAYYDPKTRAMRENPFEQTGKEAEELPYAGDNFVRWSGDAMEMARQQLFAWEAYEKGSEVNLQADPTKLDMLTQEYAKKKEQYKTTSKDSILDKYGGQEQLNAPSKQLLLGQSEDYVEYSRHGTVLKGHEKASIKSSYDEDIYINNHTSVWGSYWKDGRWGYACCHSFVTKSYCTGAAGIDAEMTNIVSLQSGTSHKLAPDTLAIEASTSAPPPYVPVDRIPDPLATTQTDSEDDSSSSSSSEDEKKRKKRKQKKREKKKRRKQKEKERKKKKKRKHSSSDSDDEDENTKKERRILKAIMKEEERQMEVDRMMLTDERKRQYNVMYDFKAPDEDEIEAYKRKRIRDEDPMAQFMN